MPVYEGVAMVCCEFFLRSPFRLCVQEKTTKRVIECVSVASGAEAAGELVCELAEYLSRWYPPSLKVSRVAPSSSTSLEDDVPTIEGIRLAWHSMAPVEWDRMH